MSAASAQSPDRADLQFHTLFHPADDVHLAGLAGELEDRLVVAVDQRHRVGLQSTAGVRSR